MHDSVAVNESEGESERESDAEREDLVGFCASPVVAARATSVRQAPSQVDFTKSAKKSAEKIRPDLLQNARDSDLGPILATWAPRCQITGDLVHLDTDLLRREGKQTYPGRLSV